VVPGQAGRLASVNGGTGALMTLGGELLGVVGVTVAGGRDRPRRQPEQAATRG
jgi:hypothetical protein